MRIALIAAIAVNNVIGNDNQIPWHLPEDLKHFKQLTFGKPIIMGRITHESIGKPLSGRANIVVSRQKNYQPEGVQVVGSLEDALNLAESTARAGGVDEVMVIGGTQIYVGALPLAQTLYLTKIHEVFEGDAYFPEVKWTQWTESDRQDFRDASATSLNYSFVTYQRV